MGIPKPSEVKAFLERDKGPGSVKHPLVALARSQYPEIVAVAHKIGYAFDEGIRKWLQSHDEVAIRTWLSPDSQPSDLFKSWNKLLSEQEELPLAGALVLERRLCDLGTRIGAYIRSDGSSFAEELLRARWLTVRSLSKYVREVPFHQPEVLTSAGTLFSGMLIAMMPYAGDDFPARPLAWIEKEVAKQIVISSRYNTSNKEQLQFALKYLEKNMAFSGVDVWAAFRLEAAVELYHLTGKRAVLEEAARFINARRDSRVEHWAWYLNAAEVWIHLSSCTESLEYRSAFLEKAREVLMLVLREDIDVTYEVWGVMLDALRNFLVNNLEKGYSTRKLRLPFSLRSQQPVPDILYRASVGLIMRLREKADRGKYIYREYLAALESKMAQLLGSSSEYAILLLEDAIRLRNPVADKSALQGHRDRLAQAQDLLVLSGFTGEARLRHEAFEVLLSLRMSNPEAPQSLIMMALSVENDGPLNIKPSTTNRSERAMIRNGDYSRLFAEAAVIALDNPLLRVDDLGGRGATYTIDDFSGFSGQSLVFKVTRRSALERELNRSKLLEQKSEDLKFSDSYGVVEHMGSITLDPGSEAEKLVSIRRYESASTLRELCENVPDKALIMMEHVACYLGLIHVWESADAGEGSGVRRVIKDRELGRWLRELTRKPNRLFDLWWNLVSSVPALPRRDAHSLNWLVNDAGLVLAVDLEASGFRPLAYELAQLIDDYPVFEPTDWESRLSVLGQYLAAMGLEASVSYLVAYQAGTAARAVGLLTGGYDKERIRDHGYGLLKWLSESANSSVLRLWCKEVLALWAEKTGLADPTRMKLIAPDDRVRISKAMSYHLRHDRNAQVGPGGWMFVENLADLLIQNGHRGVSAEQLLAVAGALGETRFQLDGHKIRAAYGFSLPRRTDFEQTATPKWLYHATATRSLSFIFEAEAGLKPMSRTMVHLTTKPIRALSTARRHSSQVVLLRVACEGLDGLVKAADDTWLVPAVEASAVEVVPVTELVRELLDSPVGGFE